MADDRARLDLLYDLARRLGAMQDAEQLIGYATGRIRELFDAEGCSVLLLDRSGRTFRFPVTAQDSGSAATSDALRQISFPADAGVAGWVLRNRQGIWVPDTASDERFYSGVDRLTGSMTRSLMCVPLETLSGPIGVVEVINPTVGAEADEDVAFLTAVAADVANAYEKADLQRRMRREVAELRWIGMTVALLLTGIGFMVAAAAALGHLARALPVTGLLLRPGVLGGLGLAAGGIGLLVAIRRAARRSE